MLVFCCWICVGVLVWWILGRLTGGIFNLEWNRWEGAWIPAVAPEAESRVRGFWLRGTRGLGGSWFSLLRRCGGRDWVGGLRRGERDLVYEDNGLRL